MFKYPILLLVFSSVLANAAEIRHVDLDGSHLVDVSQFNYAITAPALAQNNWKTLLSVSVNGDNVVAIAPNCQATVKNIHALSDAERAALGNTKTQLMNAEFGGAFNQPTSNMRRSSSRFSLENGQSLSSTNINNGAGSTMLNSNGVSINKLDENNFSIAKGGLPNNLARMFVMGDVVAYVYHDGQVQMKPASCLQPAEQELLKQLRVESKQAEEHFSETMNQSMQNLAKNLGNMFGNRNLQPQGAMYMQPPSPYFNQYPQQQQQNAYPAQMPQQQLQQQQSMPIPYPYSMPYYGANYGGGYMGYAYPSANLQMQAQMPNGLNFGTNFPFGANSLFGPNFPFGR